MEFSKANDDYDGAVFYVQDSPENNRNLISDQVLEEEVKEELSAPFSNLRRTDITNIGSVRGDEGIEENPMLFKIQAMISNINEVITNYDEAKQPSNQSE